MLIVDNPLRAEERVRLRDPRSARTLLAGCNPEDSRRIEIVSSALAGGTALAIGELVVALAASDPAVRNLRVLSLRTGRVRDLGKMEPECRVRWASEKEPLGLGPRRLGLARDRRKHRKRLSRTTPAELSLRGRATKW